METVLLFCHRAETDAEGRLSLTGVFHELYAPDFPASQDRAVLAGSIEWSRAEAGRKTFRIDLNDPDGDSIYTIEGHSDVDERSDDRAPARTQLILPLNNLVFGAPGRYRVEVAIDDRKIAGPSLHLLRTHADETTSNL